MAELHLVGTSADGCHILLARTPGAPAEFRLALDDRLRDLLRGRRPADGSSALSPRQIQAELRAGASLDDVAARAGVPVERLAPYAGPVLSELARVLEDALAARMSRPRLGLSSLPLGTAVLTRLAVADGAGPAPRWSTRRDHDATWVVEMRHSGDLGAPVARWRWDRVARSLTPLDEAAADLGHADPDSPLRAPLEAPADRPAGAAADQQAASVPAPPPVDPPGMPTRSVRSTRTGRRPSVPAWADVILGVSPGKPAGAAPSEDVEATG